MSQFYVYLISTLPTLHFGSRPPFSSQSFIAYCQRFIPEADIELLKEISPAAEYPAQAPLEPTLRKWQDFDTALRNEVLRMRASRKHIDPARYLRKDGLSDPRITHAVLSAYRSTSVLEAERMLDQERWRALDEFLFGHYFDLDFLIIYKLKLMILERWEKVGAADKKAALEEAVSPY